MVQIRHRVQDPKTHGPKLTFATQQNQIEQELPSFSCVSVNCISWVKSLGPKRGKLDAVDKSVQIIVEIPACWPT